MKLVSYNNHTNVIEGILERYGVSREDLINPSSSYKKGYFDMDRATDRIVGCVKSNEKVGILVDDDCDGFTSSAVMVSFLNKVGKNVQTFFHDGKQHGLNMGLIKLMKESGITLLIIPDASSSDELLVELPEVDIIILDHHLFESEVPQNVIRVNNQNPKNTDSNTNLTGVGMVYRTIQVLDEKLNTNYSGSDIDLVAVGQIGDSSDYSEQEVRWIVNEGLKNLNNKLIKTMLAERIGRGDKITGRDLSFEVIPYINAVTRVGTLGQKEALFKGLCQSSEYDIIHKVIKRRKNKTTRKFQQVEEERTGYELLYEELQKIKKNQAKLIESFLQTNIEEIYIEGGVVVAKGTQGLIKGLTGLITAKLTSKFGKPVILVSPDEEGVNYTGSIRGKEGLLNSLKDWCEGTGLFDWVQGHDNAAGCQIKGENLKELVRKTKDVETIEEIEVDYLSNTISTRTIREIYNNREFFGGRVEYPKVGIVRKTFDKNNIIARGETMLILQDKLENVDYVIFNVSRQVREGLLNNFSRTITVDIYGEPGINHWGGKVVPQVIVNRIEKDTNNSFDFDF